MLIPRLVLPTLVLAAGCLPPGPIDDGTITHPPAADAASSRDAASAVDDLAASAPVDMATAAPDLARKELVTMTFTTSASVGKGAYAPKNIVAVWIEASTGAFVKTAGRWADTRKQYLLGWVAKAGAADMDAISSATRPTTGTLTTTWDMTARAGAGAPPDGIYTIRMELADGDSTATTQNNEAAFTFNRNGTASTQTALTNGGFSNVSITYTGR